MPNERFVTPSEATKGKYRVQDTLTGEVITISQAAKIVSESKKDRSGTVVKAGTSTTPKVKK